MKTYRKHVVKMSAWLVLMMLLAGCETVYRPSPETVGELADPARALMAVQDSLEKTNARPECSFLVTDRGILRYCGRSTGYRLDAGYRRYQDTPIPTMSAYGSDARIGLQPYMWLYWYKKDSSDAHVAAAKQFATAWYVLARQHPPHDPTTDATFLDAIKRYRAEPQTHAETLRRVQVRVENAIKEHRTTQAATLYRDALKTAAGWPERHFNLALIYGDLEVYAEAITEMKRYLYLVPKRIRAEA